MSDMPRVEAPLFLGIDVGTTGVRALLLDSAGHRVGSGAAPTPTETPEPGMCEYPPDALWSAVCSAVRQCMASAPGSTPAPAGIAVASIGEAAFALDKAGNALANATAWFDPRGAEDAAWASERIGYERFVETTGIAPDPTLGLSKLLWLRRCRPDVYSKAVRWLNVADWVAYRMCGAAATDFTLASRTMALNVTDLAWAEDILTELDVDPGLFAPLTANGAALGALTEKAAAELGLEPGPVIGVGGHDHVCGAIAAGATRPGVMLDSFGTAEVVLMVTDKPIAPASLQGTGLVRGALNVEAPLTYIQGGLYSAGGAIEWFRGTLAAGADHAALQASAERSPAGANGVLFKPYLRGRNTPRPDANARAAFDGLSAETSLDDMARAVLEGVACAGREMADAVTAVPDVPEVKTIKLIGGGTQNALFVRIKASVYGRPIQIAPMKDGAARGAALLGAQASGAFSSFDDTLDALGEPFTIVEPEPEWVAAYADQN